MLTPEERSQLNQEIAKNRIPQIKKPVTQVSGGALVMRDWTQTPAGQDYKKQHAEYIRGWRKENREKFKASQQRCYFKLKLEVLQHYSKTEIPECKCCKEKTLDFLQLDHINGDGAAVRRKEKSELNYVGGNAQYYRLKKAGYPDVSLQVLCANCNRGKGTGKYCPHEMVTGVSMTGVALPEDERGRYGVQKSFTDRRFKDNEN